MKDGKKTMRLKDKIAIVTGAASGFGREIGRVYAREGAKVALLDLNEAGVKELAAEIGEAAIACRCDVDEAAFDRVFDVNVKSIFHMTHATLPLLREQGRGGVILNVGSTAGIRPRPGLTWYNASKAAVNLMSKSMAVELAPDKIRVCAIAPVMGNTALLETFMGVPDTPENRAKFIGTIPLGRMSEPEDIANAANDPDSPQVRNLARAVEKEKRSRRE